MAIGKEGDVVVANEKTPYDNDVTTAEHIDDKKTIGALTRTDSYQDDHHVVLGMRTWLVLFMILFGSVPGSGRDVTCANMNMTAI